MKQMKTKARREQLESVLMFLEEELSSIRHNTKNKIQLFIAVEELFVNIASYAYYPAEGDAEIDIDTDNENNFVYITFIDSGKPYNPLEREDPDVTLSAKERKIGGLGIYMVKKSMDDMSYEYKNGCNILKIGKKMI
ncbi:MAG: ATP-binding protein [Lachnospiraceae bacterium]|nr:ATP-binding protein [Lachnospiraceae bacterium]